MSGTKNKVVGSYLQEGIIFVSMFILTMLHEWIFIDTILSLFKGLVFFLLLYGQAQFHRFVVFPSFLKKKFVHYAILTLLSTLVGATILFLTNIFWLQPVYGDNQNPIWDFRILDFVYHFVICIISTATIMALSLMQSYSLELQKRNEDRLLLNEMKLKFLHAQLNPHFFFNMLNNLYGVSLTDPQRTPALIIKLSDLMRYQIENVNVTQVNLKDEIDFIRNYIDLERERVGKRCDICLDIPDNPMLLKQYTIAPLLMIILVENSFKHSLNNKYWFVYITIKLTDGMLKLDINNSCPDEKLKQASTGMGLNNIKQRLDVLYNGKYTLQNSQNESGYKTSMSVTLKDDRHG
jgi:two-component system LytT family sensor kinase